MYGEDSCDEVLAFIECQWCEGQAKPSELVKVLNFILAESSGCYDNTFT